MHVSAWPLRNIYSTTSITACTTYLYCSVGELQHTRTGTTYKYTDEFSSICLNNVGQSFRTLELAEWGCSSGTGAQTAGGLKWQFVGPFAQRKQKAPDTNDHSPVAFMTSSSRHWKYSSHWLGSREREFQDSNFLMPPAPRRQVSTAEWEAFLLNAYIHWARKFGGPKASGSLSFRKLSKWQQQEFGSRIHVEHSCPKKLLCAQTRNETFSRRRSVRFDAQTMLGVISRYPRIALAVPGLRRARLCNVSAHSTAMLLSQRIHQVHYTSTNTYNRHANRTAHSGVLQPDDISIIDPVMSRHGSLHWWVMFRMCDFDIETRGAIIAIKYNYYSDFLSRWHDGRRKDFSAWLCTTLCFTSTCTVCGHSPSNKQNSVWEIICELLQSSIY